MPNAPISLAVGVQIFSLYIIGLHNWGYFGGEEESVWLPELVYIYKLVCKSVVCIVLCPARVIEQLVCVAACLELGPSEGRVAI